MFAAACSGPSGRAAATPSPAATPSAIASATAAPTATPDALASTHPDGALALAHVRQLAEVIGPRVAGTPGEMAARDFLAATLRAYGYDVTEVPFPFDASGFLPARVDAGATAIPGYALTGSPQGSASGPLVVVGTGRAADYPAAGAHGAIVLVERGGQTFSQKVGNAVAAGAAGVVISNDQAGALLGSLSGTVPVPVVGIGKAAGDDLAARAAAGAVRVTVSVTPPRGTAYNVIATPPGVTQCATITGGHYDSVAVTGGADDNASGAAAVLEVARVIAARNERRANCFALFSGEEFGLLGSKAYVAALSPGSLRALRAMINLDVVGLPVSPILLGSPDLVDTARLAAQAQGIVAKQGALPPGTNSDHGSFIDAGVPAVMLYREDSAIHTPQDQIGRLSADALRDDVTIAVATLERLAAP